MKFDLTQLDPITREFVQSNPGGSAIQVSSRGQRLYYLAVVLLLLFLLKFRWDYFVFFVTGYLMIWYAAAVFFRGGAAVLSWFGQGEEIFSDEVRNIEKLKQKIESMLYSMLGVTATVRLVGPNTIPRSEGKAKRINDRRTY